jgi:hypothetical protein
MKYLIISIGLILSSTAFSQNEIDIWTTTDTISTNVYEFQVPKVWRNLSEMLSEGKGPEQYFEASGKGLPVSFNGGPVQVTVFLVKLDESSLKDAKNGVIEGYFSNPDRVFKNEKDYSEDTITLADGSEAVLLNTRFYRESKGFNQSRYDLATYSKKYKTVYMFTVSIQYIDDTYSFEKDYDLAEYAKRLFETFAWK